MSDHDKWLDPPHVPFVSRCPCDPCSLCGGKKLEHQRELQREVRVGEWSDTVSEGMVDCFPGEDDIICGCRECDCGKPIASDSPFDECGKCSTSDGNVLELKEKP